MPLVIPNTTKSRNAYGYVPTLNQITKKVSKKTSSVYLKIDEEWLDNAEEEDEESLEVNFEQHSEDSDYATYSLEELHEQLNEAVINENYELFHEYH